MYIYAHLPSCDYIVTSLTNIELTAQIDRFEKHSSTFHIRDYQVSSMIDGR